MRIAVTSTAPDLDAEMDPRFGRAQYLLIVDTETLEFEAIENPNLAAGAGAGIQTSQMIASKGVQAVLTGNCGPNAYQTLSAVGVQVYVGLGGPVRQAVEGFKRGELQPIAGPSVPGHFGIGMGGGRGMGMGGGRGMGMGGGRGMGMGGGRGMGMGGGRGMGMGGGRGMGMGGGRGMGMGGGRGMGMGAASTGSMPSPTPPPSREEELEQLKSGAEALKQQLEQITQRIKELEGE